MDITLLMFYVDDNIIVKLGGGSLGSILSITKTPVNIVNYNKCKLHLLAHLKVVLVFSLRVFFCNNITVKRKLNGAIFEKDSLKLGRGLELRGIESY